MVVQLDFSLVVVEVELRVQDQTLQILLTQEEMVEQEKVVL